MLESIVRRRSVRKFEKRPIEEEKLRVLKDAILRSPTSKNKKPWEFYFVHDPALLKALSKSKRHAAHVADAPVAVVIAAEGGRSDVWVEDCSIAAAILQVSAVSLGLGSCWIQIRRRFYSDEQGAEEYVRQTLKLPADQEVLAIIALGYPKGEVAKPYDSDALRWDKIHDIL